jgi:hypothetical protein
VAILEDGTGLKVREKARGQELAASSSKQKTLSTNERVCELVLVKVYARTTLPA